ncbi:putative lysophospholipase BODYGUARD 5 [Vitis vinifera]|uniref:Putative lysophospholipase BODYGUARD 5 n=1 Tax=Vitis vinifera TaxID=29760 RepID=A0A438DHF7_VITVI|nr:putative lysophospholipase BODYGUARD 5 [Vitis vinifera]
MFTVSQILSGKWARISAESFISVLSWVVFLFLDFLDTVFCIFFRVLDEFMEGKASRCYCESKKEKGSNEEGEVSETLYGNERENIFREMGFLRFPGKWENAKKRVSRVEAKMTRWSDCGCESCVSWLNNGDDQKLHVVVMEPPKAIEEECKQGHIENVIFLHGFLSSSSFWTETVFPNLSEEVKHNYRLFALDLLGFGRSPKPRDCLYTLRDHLEMIEKSVIHPFELKSFHLVAHSMGCILALALAAKYSKSVKSITLIAPPYFDYSKDGGSSMVLRKLAERRLWPPIRFGSSFMSWNLDFMTIDMTKHTHSSAWHTMHNVICGGAKSMDECLETLKRSRVKIYVIQGDRDKIVPLECSTNIKMKIPNAEVDIIKNVDHSSVILGVDYVLEKF